MPIGFSNSILGTGAGSTASNWAAWDGSNDSTYDIDTLVGGTNVTQQWLGFCAFSDTHGVTASISGAGGTRYINYHVLKNSNDTVTSPGNATGLNTGGSTFGNSAQDSRGFLTQTNGGNILSSWGNAATNDTQILSISGDTVTAHTAFNAGSLGGDTRANFIFRRPGTNVFNILNDGGNRGYKMTLTENGNSSSAAIGADITVNGDFYYEGRTFPGHVDANTMLMSTGADASAIQPIKIEFDETGSQTAGTFSGPPNGNLAGVWSDYSSSSGIDQSPYSGTPPYFTTDFNDTMLFFSIGGSGGDGNGNKKLNCLAYKAGESSFSSSNIITVSAGTIVDTHVTGCFVGADNDVFLLSLIQTSTDSLVVFKYVLSTNTLSEVFRVANGSNWDSEQARLARWGDDRAILIYNNDKIRLLTA
jgi:hypothetical protein